jgi:hypothetical protein
MIFMFGQWFISIRLLIQIILAGVFVFTLARYVRLMYRLDK